MFEFVNTKMGLQSFSSDVEYAAIAGQNSTNDRLTSLENVMEKLLKDRTSQNNRPFCKTTLLLTVSLSRSVSIAMRKVI